MIHRPLVRRGFSPPESAPTDFFFLLILPISTNPDHTYALTRFDVTTPVGVRGHLPTADEFLGVRLETGWSPTCTSTNGGIDERLAFKNLPMPLRMLIVFGIDVREYDNYPLRGGERVPSTKEESAFPPKRRFFETRKKPEWLKGLKWSG
ncbi:MAG: hypothetical protein ACFCD0_01110 [Gemmataceae bacterium]